MSFFLNELENHFSFLNLGLRLDGRSSCKQRSTNIVLGPNGGFCDLTQGTTRVIISISSFISKLRNSRDQNIQFSFTMKGVRKTFQLSETKTPFKRLNKIFFGKEIPRILSFIFKNKDFLRKNFPKTFNPEIKLLIKFKILVIENGGNVKDSIILASGLGFSSLSFHPFKILGNNLVLDLISIRNSLKEHHEPFWVSTTFIIFENSEGDVILLMDPTFFEEAVADSSFTLILSPKKNVYSICIGIGSGVEENLIKEATRISLKKAGDFGLAVKKGFGIKNLRDIFTETLLFF
mmetsp:Transcript_19162/g.39094  ORF Transcript_19162/g.39094 Transcript_19162/m.39094 type:complete len:292 (+) Transcript_19162:21-896(+)